jgi:hypothetical protein
MTKIKEASINSNSTEDDQHWSNYSLHGTVASSFFYTSLTTQHRMSMLENGAARREFEIKRENLDISIVYTTIQLYELYRLSDCRLSAQLIPTFADRGCHLVSVTYPYGRILIFLDWSRYFFFQVTAQLYSRG